MKYTGSDSDTEVEIDEGTSDDTISAGDQDGTWSEPSDRTLGDELGQIDVVTTPEGYVEGRVTGLESLDAGTVHLEVELPNEERVSFRLDKPIPWSREFLLARIVEDVGYDAASVDYLVGEPVFLARTDAGPAADEETEDRWQAWIYDAGDSVLSVFGDRYRRENDPGPEWRLVDPLELPSREESPRSTDTDVAVSSVLVVLGAIVAVMGAVIGSTGTLTVSATAVWFALPGFALLLVGLYGFVRLYA